MFWTSSIKFGAALVGLGLAGSALAGPIVIRADGPSKASFPPGKALGNSVRLVRGDTLVVIDGRGTRTLTGAGTIDLTARGGPAPSALTSLIANAGNRQVRTGAVRSAGTPTTLASPSLWYVDMARSGTVCLTDMTRASLWRTDATAPVTLTVTNTATGKSATIAFNAKQNVRSWPVGDVGLSEGIDYRIAGGALAAPLTVRFAKVAMGNTAPDAVAGALLDKNCMGQVNQLVEAGKNPTDG